MTPTTASIREALRTSPPKNVPAWRVLARVWSRDLRAVTPREVIAIARALVDENYWHRATAYELIASHRGCVEALTPADVMRLARHLYDWPSVDTFATYVAGPAWREGRLPTKQIDAWLKSEDRWLRRTGVVCTVALNVRARGGRGDSARTLAVCAKVVKDRDDMVEKAMSWALRSLVEWDRDGVIAFLKKHDTAIAPRVRREVNNKLRSGRKSGR